MLQREFRVSDPENIPDDIVQTIESIAQQLQAAVAQIEQLRDEYADARRAYTESNRSARMRAIERWSITIPVIGVRLTLNVFGSVDNTRWSLQNQARAEFEQRARDIHSRLTQVVASLPDDFEVSTSLYSKEVVSPPDVERFIDVYTDQRTQYFNSIIDGLTTRLNQTIGLALTTVYGQGVPDFRTTNWSVEEFIDVYALYQRLAPLAQTEHAVYAEVGEQSVVQAILSLERELSYLYNRPLQDVRRQVSSYRFDERGLLDRVQITQALDEVSLLLQQDHQKRDEEVHKIQQKFAVTDEIQEIVEDDQLWSQEVNNLRRLYSSPSTQTDSIDEQTEQGVSETDDTSDTSVQSDTTAFEDGARDFIDDKRDGCDDVGLHFIPQVYAQEQERKACSLLGRFFTTIDPGNTYLWKMPWRVVAETVGGAGGAGLPGAGAAGLVGFVPFFGGNDNEPTPTPLSPQSAGDTVITIIPRWEQVSPQMGQFYQTGVYADITTPNYDRYEARWVQDAQGQTVIIMDQDGNEMTTLIPAGSFQSIEIHDGIPVVRYRDANNVEVVRVMISADQYTEHHLDRWRNRISLDTVDGELMLYEEVVHIDGNYTKVVNVRTGGEERFTWPGGSRPLASGEPQYLLREDVTDTGTHVQLWILGTSGFEPALDTLLEHPQRYTDQLTGEFSIYKVPQRPYIVAIDDTSETDGSTDQIVRIFNIETQEEAQVIVTVESGEIINMINILPHRSGIAIPLDWEGRDVFTEPVADFYFISFDATVATRYHIEQLPSQKQTVDPNNLMAVYGEDFLISFGQQNGQSGYYLIDPIE